MRLASIATGTLLLLSVTACSGSSGMSATGATPMGAASSSPGMATGMPQTPNSLPAGAAVNAPVAGATGKVGTTSY